MTKKLEELFNLEDATPEVVEVPTPTHEEVRSLEDASRAVAEITRGLPQIKELDELDDKALDDLSKKAEDAYDDLMDLGLNVEVRYASRIFEVASSMMSNAITAKTAKIDKRLKAVDLQLKKLKIDNDSGTDPGDILNGAGYVITDRNELLRKLGQKD
jgi:hypothetical protein